MVLCDARQRESVREVLVALVSIRYAAAAQSAWVLVDVHAHAAEDGYAYGDVHLFSENGTLLATRSQSCVARVLL